MGKIIKSGFDKCNSCGANVTFNAEKQSLECKHCGKFIKINIESLMPKHNLAEALKNKDQYYDEWIKENRLVNCKNCGNTFAFKNFEFAKNCPYCKSSLSEETDILPILKPDNIIPFSFGLTAASETFRKQVKKRFFVSGKFKKQIPETDINGVYIPAFVFDCSTTSVYNGVLADEVEDGVDQNGSPKYRTVTRRISGTYKEDFNDFIVESSSQFSQGEIEEIFPFNFDKQKKFNDDYIRGFQVEHYDEKLSNCFSKYRNGVDKIIRRNILSRYTYSRVVSFQVNSNFSNENYCYTMLPIYNVNYAYKQKKYSAFMNGQTGSVSGSFPLSKGKISFFIILGVLMVLIPIILYLIASNRIN